MEEEAFVFRERWRGRRLWMLACASALAAALLLAMIWILPSRENGEGGATPSGGEEAQPEAEEQGENGRQPKPDSRAERHGPTIMSGDGGGAPAIVIDFPDPAGFSPGAPPPGGYQDILGRWILDMSGSAYALTNCHIILNEDGTITSPPDYDQVFQVAASGYEWRGGDTAFSASIQLILKMGSNQEAIPVRVELAGKV